jgi:hypothetical protein
VAITTTFRASSMQSIAIQQNSTNMSSKKRKFHSLEPPISQQESNDTWNTQEHADPDPRLFIQAYEADVIRGPQAQVAAGSLEAMRTEGRIHGPEWKVGDALIRWGGESGTKRPSGGVNILDAEDNQWVEDEENDLWLDRYAHSSLKSTSIFVESRFDILLINQ